jgi:hypothetical protein
MFALCVPHIHPTTVQSKCRAKTNFVPTLSFIQFCEQGTSENHFFSLLLKTTILPPSFPHSPDPIVLMMGIIMLTALISTRIRDKEKQLWQSAMSATIAKVILE